ncbi:MAG: endonuclease domain-containing protein [Bacteroidales bacterium]
MKKRSIERSMFYKAKPNIFRKAEELRNNMTEAEKLLWKRLSKKQLGVRFKAQHPIEQFIADFYCHSAKLVIELDGEIHNHQKEYDIGREAEMEKYDIRIIRFKNHEVFEDIDGVVERIKEFL